MEKSFQKTGHLQWVLEGKENFPEREREVSPGIPEIAREHTWRQKEGGIQDVFRELAGGYMS